MSKNLTVKDGSQAGEHPERGREYETPEGPRISIIVGSASDVEVMQTGLQVLDSLDIAYETRILSAHRTPRELVEYVEGLAARKVQVIIAAAGLAAHLPGVIAAHTLLPVLGIPLVASSLNGLDALLSIVQMPGGVPVGCLGLGSAGAKNAAYLAARILSLHDHALYQRLQRVLKAEHDKILQAVF